MGPQYHQRYHAHCAGLSGPALRSAIGLAAGLCFVSFGYGQGDIGGLMVEKTFANYFHPLSLPKNPNTSVVTVLTRDGGTVAAWNLGGFFGAILCVFIGDVIGRKKSIMLGLTLEVIGKILQGSATNIIQFIIGRVIAGIGNGFVASTIPSWQAECLKTHQRGTLLLVSFGTCITFGVAMAYWIVYAFSFTQPSDVSWRAPILLVLITVFPCMALISFLPESPRWLILQGKEQAAIRALSALNEIPEDSEDVRREIVQIKNAVKYMASAPVSRVFTLGEYRYLHRTLLAILLQIMQQFTGVNVFIQYLGFMFNLQLLFNTSISILLAAAASTTFFIASFVAVVGIDRFWGRRTLTMVGAGAMSVCMILLCILNYLGEHHGIRDAYYAMAGILFIYNIFFSIGWQGMSWLWSVELIPLSIRGPANAMATAANWLANFIVVLTAPVMFTTIFYKSYIIYAVINAVIVPVIYFFYPETGGRSLEEVDILFKGASEQQFPWFAVVGIAKMEPRWYDRNGEPTTTYASTENGSTDLSNEKKFPRVSQGPKAGPESSTVRTTKSSRSMSSSRGRESASDSDQVVGSVPRY